MTARSLFGAAFAAVAIGCSGGQAVTVNDSALAPADCASGQVQKLITFCASPQAADLALRNAELMGKPKAGAGDVPYSPLPIGDSPVLGPDDAAVTVVVFSDLECPYCRELHHTLTALREESPDDVRLVFKHTPLSFHEHAVPAALGALAAREQGKFWEYVDLVYGEERDLGGGTLLEHAATLGLDLEKFRNDFGASGHVAAVEADLDLASQAGVQGTPTMFVNGLRVSGLYPIEDLRALFANQREIVKRFADAGVPREHLYWRLVSVQYQPVAPSNINEDAAVAEASADVVVHVPVDGAPIRGASAAEALVTIVAFSDFQCPYCAQAVGVLDDVLAAHSADTRLAFRHFPLANHPQAGPAALASLVAQAKDKFWPYHDLLFANQQDLSRGELVRHGQALGLDATAIEAALDDPELQARVVADQKMGIDLGVQGTPTFFVNGIMVMGIESPAAFAAFVDAQREVARAVKQETGLSGEELYQAVVARNRQSTTP